MMGIVHMGAGDAIKTDTFIWKTGLNFKISEEGSKAVW
jgi:hypothetical protein